MLHAEQPTPQDTIFRDDLCETACDNIRNKTEARVIQDNVRLIVPSPETLTIFGATHATLVSFLMVFVDAFNRFFIYYHTSCGVKMRLSMCLSKRTSLQLYRLRCLPAVELKYFNDETSSFNHWKLIEVWSVVQVK